MDVDSYQQAYPKTAQSETGFARGRKFFVGLDLGQMQDWTALSLIEKFQAPQGEGYVQSPATYDVRHLERMRVPYPEVVDRVSTFLWQLHNTYVVRQPAALARYRADIEPHIELAVDGTGVGVAVVDLFRAAKLPGSMTAITITGGDTANTDGDVARVPKRDLAGIVQVMLQANRLRIGKHLDLAAILQNELLNFRVKISLTGHDSYGAGSDWRQANHDDLVLSVAMALWKAENETWGWEMVGDELARVLGLAGL